GLGVGFAAGSLLVVVGAGGGIGVHAGEGGQEHGSFELPVSAPWGVFAVDRGARRLRGRGQAGVGGEVGGGGEAGAVADGDQQDGGGPDADAGHRRQDRGKRVGLQQGVDLGFQGPALGVDGGERGGQGGHDDVEGAGAGHDDGLFVE